VSNSFSVGNRFMKASWDMAHLDESRSLLPFSIRRPFYMYHTIFVARFRGRLPSKSYMCADKYNRI
jgi:hypothetical protein